ncbi:MAG: rhodanese-like domain-containing protein, partial [Planctomycetota bacterium]
KLIDRDDVLLVDTRNRYEYDVGTFHAKGNRAAIDPETNSFREFPEYVDTAMDPAQHKKVAMFCTGGIRCEKATAYLKQRGFDEVYHLRGGILKYLERIPEEESRWQGECFVFDDRVAVGNNLKRGSFVLCYGCRLPVHVSQQSDPRYRPGVSCPHCYATLSSEKKTQLEERQRQVEIARARGKQHIGDAATTEL